MTLTLSQPLSWMKMTKNEKDFIKMQNITFNLLKGLIEGEHFLKFHRQNMIYDFQSKINELYHNID